MMDRAEIAVLAAVFLIGIAIGYTIWGGEEPDLPTPIYGWPTPRSDCYVVFYDDGPLQWQARISDEECAEEIAATVLEYVEIRSEGP